MYKEKVRTIGISLLGGNSGTAGRYELGIDSIGITNDEYIEPTARGELCSCNFYLRDQSLPTYSIWLTSRILFTDEKEESVGI